MKINICAAMRAVVVVAALIATPAAMRAMPATAAPSGEAIDSEYAGVRPRPLVFPQDYGSHPEFRTEWWYVTGWLTTDAGEALGFQITFFRTKPNVDKRNPSAFAPHQLLIAHCAISDPKHGHLWQDQRIRRAGLGLAGAMENDTRVWIDQWSLARERGVYQAHLAAENFSLQLSLENTQAPLLNGAEGVSQKGPAAASSSYYYSLPHMKVSGTAERKGASSRVSGEAWFDHEWSSEYLDPNATGWDWIGINLDDGSALMAFRIRDSEGNTHWAGGTFRAPGDKRETFTAAEVRFEPVRTWTSPRTGTRYPVQWRVRAGSHQYILLPLMDDQENDTRLSTGAIYWEGAVRAVEADKPVGKGYLELTGYGERLRLR